MTSFLELPMGMWPNSTGMVPGWSPTKIVQMVLIGCISRSRGQKLGLQMAIFKNLVWNYKAQSFQIWYTVRTQYNDTVGSNKICQHIEFSSILNFIIHHVMTYLFTVLCTICTCIYNKNVLCLFYHKHDI